MAYEPCTCPDVESSGLRLAMGDIRNAIAGILDHSSLLDYTSLADVSERIRKLRKKLDAQQEGKGSLWKEALQFNAKSY